MKKFLVVGIYLLLTFVMVAQSAEPIIYVNNKIGDDKLSGTSKIINGNDGPFKTIQKALNIVKTSGRIEIINTGIPYPSGNKLSKTGGTKENPLIIEGNGAEINGLAEVKPEEWKQVDQQIFSKPFWPMSNQLKSNTNYNYWIDIPQIWWLDGKPGTNCKSAEELAQTPGGFWWNKTEKTVWFHLPKNKTFDKISIKMPEKTLNAAGTCFNVAGNASYVVIQNLIAKYAHNDGFSVHGNVEGVIFKNCISTDNCGQGFSMHENAKVTVEDSFATRNASSGTCDVNNATVTYKRCVFKNNSFEAGIYTTETVTAVYEDCIISNNQPFEQIWQRGKSTIALKNCVIQGNSKDKTLATIDRGTITFENCTLMDAGIITFSNANALSITNSLLVNVGDITKKPTVYSITNSETNSRTQINNNLTYIDIKKDKLIFPTSKKSGAKLPAAVIKLYQANY